MMSESDATLTPESRVSSEMISQIAEKYGLETDLCNRANAWAESWLQTMRDTGTLDSPSPQSLTVTRDMAADELGTAIPRDIHGKPSFRTEFTATQILTRLLPKDSACNQLLAPDPNLIVPLPNFKQLDAIVDTLIAERAANRFPYHLDAAQLPQDEANMPASLPLGGREHAVFLFNSCYYMRGGIKSVTAFKQLSAMYEMSPELFDPFVVKDIDPEFVRGVLAQHGLNYKSKEVSKSWVTNSARLVDQFDGDPRNIFEDNLDYFELLRRVRNQSGKGFIGFQKKMASMLSYYLMSAGLVQYRDYPLPVDFHVLRVSAATDIIGFENMPADGDIYKENVLDLLRDMYRDYSVTHGVSQLDVCDAVWSLSSAICGVQPGNVMVEPNKSRGRQGRKTEICPLEIDVNDARQQRMYEKSCSLCPIEKDCHQNFPSKTYYVRGKMIGSPRIRFPQTTLF